ncbi:MULTISPECIES: hypothetical protein [unclassified Mesorhizobium]|uniref:hypothetical protein n=1 Tax=unclassified Mesorhizobium TaxID=325217 RepID=UPI0012086007|nr:MULTISPECIES: hypothetical protein [unclassified Mesorhizobium]TIV53396.1 MAG: hypothetical protein E5V80_32885 [Mesorhizobium sp.]
MSKDESLDPHTPYGCRYPTGEHVTSVSRGRGSAIASASPFTERTNDLSNGLIWPKDGCRLERLCRNGAARVSSPGRSPFLARQETRACAILRFAAVASDAAALAFGLTIAIEVAWCGLGNEEDGD